MAPRTAAIHRTPARTRFERQDSTRTHPKGEERCGHRLFRRFERLQCHSVSGRHSHAEDSPASCIAMSTTNTRIRWTAPTQCGAVGAGMRREASRSSTQAARQRWRSRTSGAGTRGRSANRGTNRKRNKQISTRFTLTKKDWPTSYPPPALQEWGFQPPIQMASHTRILNRSANVSTERSDRAFGAGQPPRRPARRLRFLRITLPKSRYRRHRSACGNGSPSRKTRGNLGNWGTSG